MIIIINVIVNIYNNTIIYVFKIEGKEKKNRKCGGKNVIVRSYINTLKQMR